MCRIGSTVPAKSRCDLATERQQEEGSPALSWCVFSSILEKDKMERSIAVTPRSIKAAMEVLNDREVGVHTGGSTRSGLEQDLENLSQSEEQSMRSFYLIQPPDL